ncbi:DUF4255 domain-containing protein [Saccharothrix coeruleofusca]|uniref:Pvc16 N-terminal domain-containing protein n=1 Tax=Saccharothrix coeruleofusca TaxID=33919 RepID=A0A918ECS8_9PSEU|nr:DUF4255 domain-containing protein [Saccharothrix coeruleofusca]GGP52361.1 hypothetical protein GCM10010185_25560 [Saccharothrix coeruleofusca]
MSNFLAVATATRALQTFLARAVAAVEVGATVATTKPPADPTSDALVTVFLYQVVPNAALRNRDTVTRAGDGTVLKRPQAAIDLHYLISFYGDESDFVPQRLLGAVVAALHEQPVLTRSDIQDAVSRPPLLGSDLAASPQLVRFTPTQMDLDDLSKLWSTMLQTPYALSVPYQATAVLLDGQSLPTSGKPVLRRQVAVTSFTRPVIDEVLSLAPDAPEGTPPDDGPITAERHLVLRGANLGRPGLSALVGGVGAEVVRARENAVVLAQPDDLPAGVHPVQLRYDVAIGDAARPWLESNAAPYVRRPRVLQAAPEGDGALRVELDIPVRPEQRVTLLLDERAPQGKARGHQFTAPFPLPPGATQVVPIRDVGAGTYLVRVQVDGAESPLTHADGTFAGPTVDISG